MSGQAQTCLLLVEDDPLVRVTVALMLEDEGFAVVEASDAWAALRLFEQGLNAPVLVTDVDLGAGPSGADLADALHRTRPDLAIIFITGRVASLQGRVLGPQEALLPKPFETQALSRLVRRMAAG